MSKVRVPKSRFKREIRKWMRANIVVHITRCGKDSVVYVPIADWETMSKQLAGDIDEYIRKS